MAIYIPGKRDRHGHAKAAKRSAVAVLQLTAMVDMFTVLVVFLLQNYATTNQILPIEDSVALPDASAVKELKPSNVVVLAPEGVRVNNTPVATIEAVKASEDWLIPEMKTKIEELISEGEKKKKTLGAQLRQAVTEAKDDTKKEEEVDDFRKITIQADKMIDFLSVKKVMYTATEAGIYEINFAVIKVPGENKATN
ncbi:MAG: ExbD/TolR family protein [Bdellovibrionales bacterium]